MNKTRASALMSFVALASTVMLTIPAHAETFNFSDEYYVSSLSRFHSVFGSGATGYGTAGLYQETNTTAPTITKLGNGSIVPGEFGQNDALNAGEGLQLSGWGQSLNNGQQVADVYNTSSPSNGPLSLVYKTGMGGSLNNGTKTAFNLNSIDFKGSFQSADLKFTLEGLLAGNLVDSKVLEVTGNTLTTFMENWTNIDTVEIVSTLSLPDNWGFGSLYMDNIVINNPIASATPEPSSLLLLGTGLLGLGAIARRRLCT